MFPKRHSDTGRACLFGCIASAVLAALSTLSVLGSGVDVISSAETFESYSSGYDIAGSLGWQHGPSETAIVTNGLHNGLDTPFIDVWDGAAYTNVLYLNGTVSNVYEYVLTNLVYVDMMIRPTMRISPPDISELGDNPGQFVQVACYVNATNQLVFYHGWYDNVNGYGRRWTTIPYPLVRSNEWNRITFTFCYNQSDILRDAYFMIQINGNEPFTHDPPYGYIAPADHWNGSESAGPWFQTANSAWFDQTFFAFPEYGWFRGVEITCQNMPTLVDNLSVTSPPPSGVPITVGDETAVEGNP